MTGATAAPNCGLQNSAPVAASWCPPYAKAPSGEPISAAFLTRALVPGDAAAAEISGFRVDEASVIQGRHSTTFRLLVDWSSSPTGAARRAGESAAAAAAAVGNNRDALEAGGSMSSSSSTVTCSCDPVGSVFVKRMTCGELPPRSLIKWR